jgi:hypothetical protein
MKNLDETRTFLNRLRWELIAKEYNLTHKQPHPEIDEKVAQSSSDGLLLPERTIIETPDGLSQEQREAVERSVIEQVAEERRMQLDAVETILELIEQEVDTDDNEIIYGVNIVGE